MYLLKRLCFADAVRALRCGEYRIATAIGINVIRNRMTAANSVRRSKWYLR